MSRSRPELLQLAPELPLEWVPDRVVQVREDDFALQEARDPRVPLYDRIKFLAIFSSNLDEYFRVRVASLRSLLNLKKKMKKKLGIDPAGLLDEIRPVRRSPRWYEAGPRVQPD